MEFDHETMDMVQHEPSLYLFIFNCYKKFRGWMPIYQLRMHLQETFRRNHLADCMIWEMQFYLAKDILRYLNAFKKHPRSGYPGCFSEYNENEWKNKEDYDAAITEGRILGGGEAAWEKIIDECIMAFEYVVNDGNFKKESAWFIKHFGMDPHAEDQVNKYEKWEYRYKDDPKHIGCTMSFNEEPKCKEGQEFEFCKHSIHYGNTTLITYAEEVVNIRLEQFGRFFRSFWD
jgi:hypothetical protein